MNSLGRSVDLEGFLFQRLMHEFVARCCFCVAHDCEVVADFGLGDLVGVAFYFDDFFAFDFLSLVGCDFEFTGFHFERAFVGLGVWVDEECEGCELL